MSLLIDALAIIGAFAIAGFAGFSTLMWCIWKGW